jgi:acyl-CoA synthetase (AMP-forming)/AMP-acid ligase II
MTGSQGSSSEIGRAGRLTVFEVFRAQARERPDALALHHGERRVSFAALDARVGRAAAALHRRGLRRGDRIALLSENRIEFVECLLAAAALGVIVACQNWRLAAAELRGCIDLATPSLAIVSPRHAPLLQATGAEVPDVLEFEGSYEREIDHSPTEPPALEPVDPEDGLLIIYTSGTTGAPKGALISHRAEIARMTVLRMDLRATEEDAFVAWAPLFHMGSADQTLGALMSGAPVIVSDGFDARTIVDAAATYTLGWLLLMPGSIEPVVDLVRREGVVPKGIRAVGAMADLVPIKLIAELSGLMRAPYLNSFGSTETGLPPASRRLFPPGVAPASLSKLKSSLCDVRIVDPEGRDVRDGQAGEVAVRGPTVFSGYWNAHATNMRDFADGWFRMGDLFRRNTDGSFDFVDRAKYMIKSGGENIYPAEIERVLLADPRVADAVVVRKRDVKWGEVPVAYVAAGPDGVTAAELDALCRAALAGYKRPKEIHFVAFDDFPRSTTGKIQRHEVERWLG